MRIGIIPLILFSGIVVSGCVAPTQEFSRASLIEYDMEPVDNFARADGSEGFDFPADFGPHPDFQTEWWYYTGNLQTDSGGRFGYQMTFFRRALEPASERTSRASAWGTEQIYMAHFAVSNSIDNEFQSFERFSRGAAGLAGAELPYRVWLEDWEVIQLEPGVYNITAGAGDIAIDFTLTDLKGPIPQGIAGYSQKGSESGDASYYYSQTRLETTGTIRFNGADYEVSGLSWKDHEYSTSALSEGQTGWDWFSIQLDNNTELMLYHIRRDDGSIDSYSTGTFVDTDGTPALLRFIDNDYSITVTDTWISPHSGARYPNRWVIDVPEYDLSLTLTPIFNDQELNLSYTYWEGAVNITGFVDEKAISGVGYVEMTGYAESMEDEF